MASKKVTQTPLTLKTTQDFLELTKCFIKYRKDFKSPTVLPFTTREEIDSAFKKIAKSSKSGTIVTILFVPRIKANTPVINYARILAETDTVVEAGNGNSHIYVSSPGILGILFSGFCIVVFYLGVKCAMEVDAPAVFASNEFKYGREM